MATLKITARDSSSAMEEVSKKLGADAYILATTTKEGGVEIEATNDPIEVKKFTDKAKKSFPSLIKRELGNITQFPKKNNFDSVSRRSVIDPILENPSTTNQTAFSQLNQNVQSLLDEIKGMYITDSHGLGTEIGQTTAVKLNNAGFDNGVIKRLSPSFYGLNYDRGRTAFMKALASTLTNVEKQPDNADITFVVGLSGVGKTNLTSKLAAAKMGDQKNKVVLASLDHKNNGFDEDLRAHARMLNAPVLRLTQENLIETLSSTKDKIIIDVSVEASEVVDIILDVEKFFSDRSFASIVPIPGGTNKIFIRSQASMFRELRPCIALTKLDECDISSIEISEFFLNEMKIYFLTGSKSIMGGLSRCNTEILSQYLLENC